MKDEEIIGKKFNRLTIIERVDDYVSPKGKHLPRYKCLCDCGNMTIVNPYNVLSGATKSCGCLNSEIIIRRNKSCKKFNDFEVHCDYVIMYTSKGEPFYVDLEDFDKVKNICWHKDKKGYIVDRNNVRIHRYITCCPENYVVDHIGENSRYDNRKANLRICTPAENSKNKKLYKSNSSGVTGVFYDSNCQKWRACIGVNGKLKHLGSYDTKEEAILARKTAEEKFFGDYSHDHSQRIYNEINLADYKPLNNEVNNNA